MAAEPSDSPPDQVASASAVDLHTTAGKLAQLRHKLEPDQGNPRYLITSPGLGYRFDASGSGT